MKTPDSGRLPHEQALLEHYREHDDARPSAELDARVLAAARQALAPARPSLLARLRDLLRQPQRFALAFGSLASIALVLGLVLRGLPDEPQVDDRQVAPVLREEAAKKLMAPSAAMPSPAPLNREMSRMAAPPPMEVLADQPAAAESADVDAAYAPRLPSKPLVPPAQIELDQALGEILQLQEQGRDDQAAQMLQTLRKSYPARDLDARLEQARQARDAAVR